MSDLISRSALLEQFSRYDYRLAMSTISENIQAAPAVDAVPVVRCKDCQWSKPYKRADEQTGYYCQHPAQTFSYGINWERIFEPVKAGTDFCSSGEREEDGDNESK